jgi:hypothetical protein
MSQKVKPLSDKKKKKETKKRNKELRDILAWMDIQKIDMSGIYLSNNKSNMIVKGIVLSPINPYLMNEEDTQKHILRLSVGLDKAKFEIYYKFIKSIPRVDYHLSNLSEQMKYEDNPNRRKMIQLQIDKLDWFVSTHTEAIFPVMVVGDEEHIDKKYEIMQQAFIGAGFLIRPMTVTDYENVVKEQFENEIVNEYMYSICMIEEELANAVIE